MNSDFPSLLSPPSSFSRLALVSSLSKSSYPLSFLPTLMSFLFLFVFSFSLPLFSSYSFTCSSSSSSSSLLCSRHLLFFVFLILSFFLSLLLTGNHLAGVQMIYTVLMIKTILLIKNNDSNNDHDNYVNNHNVKNYRCNT